MKIVFICGSLEPGRDGVGDYTRQLAKQLILTGHQISIIALNDRFLNEKVEGIQTEHEVNIPVLRLPSCWKIKNKINNAKIWIDQINPDWLSLQYVIFSFHNKGLPIVFHKQFKNLGRDRTWHIMFHELWVGIAENDTFKRKLHGKLQKLLVKSLIKVLSPKVIHTQCDLFLRHLIKEKYQVKKLPLFSNIDVYPGNLVLNDTLNYGLADSDTIKFAFFGALHPEAKFSELVIELKKYEHATKTAFEFLYIGRNGHELNHHTGILDKENVKYTVFGEMEPRYISHLLSGSSFGISTGAPQLLEKNGTVATMLAHNLPVICIGKEMVLKNIGDIKMLNNIYYLEDIIKLLSQPPLVESAGLLSFVMNKYIYDLKLSE